MTSSSRRSSLGPANNEQYGLRAPSRAAPMGNNSSANSIASSDTPHEGSSGMRSSLEDSLSKFTSRFSEDGHRGEGKRRRMSKLLKGRRRRKSVAHEEDSSPLEVEEVPPMPEAMSLDQFQSQESLGLAKSVASSLILEDSDTEQPAPLRPSISPHQSHAGYLTLSSPLIASETIDSTVPSTVTLDDPASPTRESPASKHSLTHNVGSNTKQSPSPIGKLKEAFSPKRRGTSPRPRGESDSPRPGTSGSGTTLGALFGSGGKGSGSRRGSKGFGDSGQIYGSPEQIEDTEKIQSTSSLLTVAPKRISTTIPATPPNLIETPATVVTPPTPTDAKPLPPNESSSNIKSSTQHRISPSNPNIVVSPAGTMISHRRGRSTTNHPSKLSNSVSAPLSPTIEETKTPGGTLQSPTGFFSSVFSAAQNAANTFSNTIANTTSNTKGKGNSSHLNTSENKTDDVGGEEVIGPENADESLENSSGEKKRLAVETLGSGNLSLAALGISDSSERSPMSSTVNLSMATDQASAQAEDIGAAEAVSAAYATERSPQSDHVGRSRSLTNPSDVAVSPPRGLAETDSPVHRTGSIRSRISGGRKRRHRGSSVTTGNTIAAVIGASTSTLAPSAAQANGQRLNGTGFAVASPKRNRDFHSLFKSVPEDDYLIEDYSAALQREILLQGRLYVSEGHLCFSSNILGWVTNLVISFDEVVSVEKKSTAVVFPNAIVIQTLHARNVFASFLSRDTTYDLIIGIWKISHPNLKSSLNGVTLDGSGTGDKTEKAESIASDDVSSEDSDDEVYDEDAEEEEGLGSFTEAGEGSFAGSDAGSVVAESRKASAAVAAAVGSGSVKPTDAAEAAAHGTSAAQDFPGPATHAPTDCGDTDSHYDKLLIDTTIPAPMGKIYSMMFGPASGVWMRKWLIEDQKSSELQMEDDKKGLDETHKTFSFSYIKPLGGSIGPKQTKCNIDMTLEQFDLDKAVTVLCSTQTPDVPSGSIFVTKTRYCLMWGANNSTRLIMTFTVEWSGKSWLKGPIEKGANDGQLSYANALTAALRASISAKPSKAPRGAKARKRSKMHTSEETTPTPGGTDGTTQAAAKSQAKNWGLLEPVRGLLGPLADPLEALFSTQVLIGVLLFMIAWLYFFRIPSSPSLSNTQVSLSTPERLAAYEQIWRAEENELWQWLDERVAMDQTAGFGKAGEDAMSKQRQKREMANRLKDDPAAKSMNEREIDEAIRITQERLEGMKRAVLERKGMGQRREE
ncbi:hypothetical protein GQ43DRAFT_437158 [Delitschia confertaspora ATCC 74209]|uniref:VASt domain-containing protein n=1 Tax=Delitschia confertaspora ATCC 74209 TaxID=1513339 RepID=A0A9P4JZ87_9PLEO|nr:hypothetical protein GQ43DRAFT_437158 [Delitschia confertaspora ATCC 74209]